MSIFTKGRLGKIAIISSALVALMVLPSISGSAAPGDAVGFKIKSQNKEDSSITATVGAFGKVDETPVDTDTRGIFRFTVDDTVCQSGKLADTSINFGGLSDNPEITDPDGNTVAVTGRTYTPKNGVWTFRGSFERIRNTTAAGAAGVARCVKSVDEWRGTGTTDIFGAFRASGIERMVEPPRTVTDMGYLFNSSLRFNDPTIKNWDTSNVTNMRQMFQGGVDTMTQDLSGWNVCKIPTRPDFFKTGEINAAIEPQWGVCS